MMGARTLLCVALVWLPLASPGMTGCHGRCEEFRSELSPQPACAAVRRQSRGSTEAGNVCHSGEWTHVERTSDIISRRGFNRLSSPVWLNRKRRLLFRQTPGFLLGVEGACCGHDGGSDVHGAIACASSRVPRACEAGYKSGYNQMLAKLMVRSPEGVSDLLAERSRMPRCDVF